MTNDIISFLAATVERALFGIAWSELFINNSAPP